MGSGFRNASHLEIFVVDADTTFNDSLAMALMPDGFRVIGFQDGDSFLTLASTRPPGCVLLDVDMTDRTGSPLLSRLDVRLFPAPIVVTSARHDADTIVDAIKRGAVDFIEKPLDIEEVVERIHRTIERFRHHFPGCDRLTPREQQVLSRIARGAFNREMSRDLGISDRTIEVHRAHIMRKLRARNTADLVRIALSGAWNDGALPIPAIVNSNRVPAR